MKGIRVVLMLGVLCAIGGTCFANMQVANQLIMTYKNGEHAAALTQAADILESSYKYADPGGGYADQALMARVSAIVIASKIWMEQGQQELALEKCAAELEKIPEQFPLFKTIVRNARADVWASLEEYEKVLAEFKEILAISPTLLEYSRFAWFLATCPDEHIRDGERALEIAQKAVEMKKTSTSMNALAAAYAETGNFQEAVKAEKEAMTLLGEKQQALVAVYKTYLAAYEAEHPWHEPPQAMRGDELAVRLLNAFFTPGQN